jgi:pimeloyl-ACP methyl ester carboxylesterase
MADGAALGIGDFAERVVATIDGLSLYVRDYPALEPQTGLPVICLHGLTRNSRDFEVVAPRISALGRRVLVPDMRGRGKSANDSDPAHYAVAVYAQDVMRVMDELGAPKAVFVGTSMGGLITMTLAATGPDRIAAAVLNDIGPRLETAGLARIAGYVGRGEPRATWKEAAEAVRAIGGSAYPGRLDDEAFWLSFAKRVFKVDDEGRVVLDYDANIALAFAQFDQSAPTPDLSPLFQALAAKPVLALRGALSDLLSVDGLAHMKALKPDLETMTLDNIGHAPTLEEPDAWDAILSFLAKVD